MLKKIYRFFSEVRSELKKVHWPNRKEFIVFTWIVLVAIVVLGTFFYILDSFFTAILRFII
ncbi:MAG: preprotein translocase subunit SecE [Dethiobacteria bacterium]